MTHHAELLHKFSSALWLILVLTMAGYTSYALLENKHIQFDLLALLPESENKHTKAAQQFLDHSNASEKVIILIGGKDSEKAEKAFLRLRQHIKNLPNLIQETDTQSTGEEHKSFFKSLYKYRLGILSPEDRLLLIDNKGDKIAQRSLKAYTNPFSDLGPPQLKSDPFYLFPSFVKSHHQDMDISQDANGNSFLIANDKTWYLFQGSLTNPTFSLKTQEALTSKLAPFFKTLQKENEVEILKTGAIFYAAAGAKSAQEEISFVADCHSSPLLSFCCWFLDPPPPLP